MVRYNLESAIVHYQIYARIGCAWTCNCAGERDLRDVPIYNCPATSNGYTSRTAATALPSLVSYIRLPACSSDTLTVQHEKGYSLARMAPPQTHLRTTPGLAIAARTRLPDSSSSRYNDEVTNYFSVKSRPKTDIM